MKSYKDHWSVRCEKCGHSLNGQVKEEQTGYSQKCNACGDVVKYNLK